MTHCLDSPMLQDASQAARMRRTLKSHHKHQKENDSYLLIFLKSNRGKHER